MRTLEAGELDQLDRMASEHPDLVALAARSGLGSHLPPIARSVVRRLVGAPDPNPATFATLLFQLGRSEFALLESICRGRPLQAIVATALVLERTLGKVEEFEQPDEDDDRGVDDYEDDDYEDDDYEDDDYEDSAPSAVRHSIEPALRERLTELAGGPLPTALHLPQLDVDPSDPLAVAFGYATHFGLVAASRHATTALQAAESHLDLFASLVPGLGWDLSVGQLHRRLLADLPRLLAILERSSSLSKVVDELGRQEGAVRSQRRAERGGREDTVGVTVGGELSDVLTSELALLGDDDTEDLFYQRFIERRLVCLELQGTFQGHSTAPDKRGPVVACVDTSGSMEGDPEVMAKALILRVVRQAVRQHRRVHLMLFGGPGAFVDITVEHGGRAVSPLLDFLTMRFGGGTDFDGPLVRALDVMTTPDFRRADVLVVTDGLCRASRRVVDRVAAARESQGLRVVSVVFGGDVGGVDEFSDTVYRMDPTRTETVPLELWTGPSRLGLSGFEP